MSTIQWTTPASIETVLSTELNSLASAAGAVSDVLTSDRKLYGDLELVVTFGTAPTDGSLVEVYVATRQDGTNFEDYATGASGYGPRAGFVGGFPVRNVTTGQRIHLRQVVLPPVDFRIYVLNRTGQSMAASGNTVKLRRYTEEVV